MQQRPLIFVWLPGKPVTLIDLYQLKAYELRMKTSLNYDNNMLNDGGQATLYKQQFLVKSVKFTSKADQLPTNTSADHRQAPPTLPSLLKKKLFFCS
jgi:hypothetical protein